MPQNNRMLYRKVGRRYEPVGEDFTGFPADGVWYVQNDTRRMTHIMKIGDLPDPRPLVELEQYRDAACTALTQAAQKRQSLSFNDLVTIIFQAVAAASQGNRISPPDTW
jgi:hypothetical protein